MVLTMSWKAALSAFSFDAIILFPLHILLYVLLLTLGGCENFFNTQLKFPILNIDRKAFHDGGGSRHPFQF